MEDANWFSLKWFFPSTLMESFDWVSGIYLYALPLVLLVFILKWGLISQWLQKFTIAFPKSKMEGDASSFLRFIPDIILALVLANLILVLARPQRSNEKVEQWTEGIDIVVAIDISTSMIMHLDFKPNRLEAAKDVVSNFVDGRFQDRIGMVIFKAEAYSLAPLTTDYNLLKGYINDLDANKIKNDGTAIGSAIAVSINRMSESESKSKVMIIVSDGDNTAGTIDPFTAANLADAYGIKIYTIAIGKKGKVPRIVGVNQFTGQNVVRYLDSNLNEATLREIAKIGNGKFYRVTDNRTLENVFKEIDQLEKAEIKETHYKDTTDFYPVYLKWALVLFLIWLLLKSSFMNNVLND